MNKKTKNAIVLGGVGGVIGFTTTYFLKKSNTVMVVSSLIGIAVGAAIGLFLVKDNNNEDGESDINSDQKENRKIVFTRVK